MTMWSELLIPAWTLFSVSVGVLLGYTVAVAAQNNDGEQ